MVECDKSFDNKSRFLLPIANNPINKGYEKSDPTRHPVTKGRRQKGAKKSGHTLSPKYSNSSFPEVLGGGGRLGSRSENVKIKIDIFKQK